MQKTVLCVILGCRCFAGEHSYVQQQPNEKSKEQTWGLCTFPRIQPGEACALKKVYVKTTKQKNQ